jgi:hypothetical protein
MADPEAIAILAHAVETQQTAVVLASVRGKADATQMVAGLGGIPSGQLLKFDLAPKGGTWLWERLDLFLTELAKLLVNHPINARILLLDLSGSMASQLTVLKRMWASVPNQGVRVSGCEVMVCSDGQDCESAGEFQGTQGLVALLGHAQELGWDCGFGNDDGALGKLYITLLDVGDGSASQGLANTLDNSKHTAWLHTREVDTVARVVRSARPAVHGLLSAEQLNNYDPLDANALQEIQSVERFLRTDGRQGFDLGASLEQALGALQGASRRLARTEALDFLHALLVNAKTLQVNKRGAHKGSHSTINSLLYQLEPFGIVQHTQAAPRLWTRDVMHSYALEPLEALRESESPTDSTLIDRLLTDQGDELDALIKNPEKTKALIGDLLKRLREQDHQTKRQRK